MTTQYYDQEASISDLPYALLMDISNELGKDWRRIIQVLPRNYYQVYDIESFASAMYMGEKPAMRLLWDLGTKGQTVRHLMSYLESLKLENALKLLKPPEPLYLSKEPEDGTYQEGSTVTLECDAGGFPSPRYQWYHLFKTKDGRVVKKTLPEGIDRILTIPNISHTQSGSYHCNIYHILANGIRSEMTTRYVYITVIPAYNTADGQAPVIKKEPKSVTILKGKPFHLECRAEGTPEPQYIWYKRGHNNDLHKQGKEIRWEQANFEDRGRYICKAYNRKGEIWSKEVTINVVEGGPPPEDAVIKIERHPVDSVCLIGGKHTLECQATSKLPLHYQWYKDDKELEGKTNNKLHFDVMTAEDKGRYHCKIFNKAGSSQISNSATIDFKTVHIFNEGRYFANDKVALLIGNKDYRGIDSLTAVNHDVHALQGCLQLNLHFKCLSLMNLNRTDIQKAVSIFCDVITENSYAVFYFSGHGFQHLHRTYMLPVDAHVGYTSEESICVQDIQKQIQEKKPALNAMFLDICRSRNENERGPVNTNMESYGQGNSIIFCASNIFSEAFELRGDGGVRPRGIFSDYLVKRLCQKEKLTEVIDQVRIDVANDPKACRYQFPEVQTDLRFPLSLHDPTPSEVPYKVTELTNTFWKPLISTLAAEVIIENVKMYLKYTWAFSNVMRVDLTTIGHTDSEPRLEVYPTGLTVNDITNKERPTDPRSKIWHIENIQRAQPSLVISLDLNGKCHKRKLIFPAMLLPKLWNAQRRAPVCVERDFPDSNQGFSSGSSGLCGTMDTMSLNRDPYCCNPRKV